MTFQSRFGRGAWLQPYTSQTVRELAGAGVKRIAVLTPGFAADCLETLEEIGVENADYFREAGGERFAAIPCLNDSADGMAVIEAVARRELKGWRSERRCCANFVRNNPKIDVLSYRRIVELPESDLRSDLGREAQMHRANGIPRQRAVQLASRMSQERRLASIGTGEAR